MNQGEIVARVRSMTRDLSNSIFRLIDVNDFINEGIDRCVQVIPQFKGMVYLAGTVDVPKLIPNEYHQLLAVYSASRCFFQDERHYQATNLMNEFEVKLDELKGKIESGEVIIKDETGNPVTTEPILDYVVNNYFVKSNGLADYDPGVEGVE